MLCHVPLKKLIILARCENYISSALFEALHLTLEPLYVRCVCVVSPRPARRALFTDLVSFYCRRPAPGSSRPSPATSGAWALLQYSCGMLWQGRIARELSALSYRPTAPPGRRWSEVGCDESLHTVRAATGEKDGQARASLPNIRGLERCPGSVRWHRLMHSHHLIYVRHRSIPPYSQTAHHHCARATLTILGTTHEQPPYTQPRTTDSLPFSTRFAAAREALLPRRLRRVPHISISRCAMAWHVG